MRTRNLHFVGVWLVIVLGAQSALSQTDVPDGWRKIDAEGRLTFYLPPEMKQSNVHGIENLYQVYSNGRLKISLVFEPDGVLAYEERESQFGKDYQEIMTEVDGRPAFLFIYRRETEGPRPQTYNADIYVGDLPRAQVKLWMWASSTSLDDIEIARRIFSSVEFTKDKPTPD
ncbi:MAG: hypothetical protein H0W99_15075 [Acidobacteria bacterium]|nr:hypothetical protein [Acidobacteriota bacterium]